MADPLGSVAAGQPSPLVNKLGTVNAVLDACRAVRATGRGTAAGAMKVEPEKAHCVVWVRNDTGGSLAAFSVVALGTPVISAVDYPHEVRQQPVFPGAAPAANTDAFAVLLEPAATSAIVRAAVVGVVPVDLSVTDAAHGYAEPAATVTATLASASTGPAKVIWKESGTGTKRAVVLLGSDSSGTRVIPVELTSTYDATTGYDWKRLQLDLGTPGFEDASPAETGDSAFTLDDNQDLPSGTRGILVQTGAGWTLIADPEADPPAGSVTGPGWVAGLTEEDCLSATAYAPVGGLGSCADITAQTLHLINDGWGEWTSPVDFVYPTGSGPFRFWVEDGRPHASISGVELVLDSAGVSGDAYYVDFTGGEGLGMCDGTHAACGSNTFIVRVQCEDCIEVTCCPGRVMPYVLYFTFSGGTGDCTCLDDVTIPAVNSGLFLNGVAGSSWATFDYAYPPGAPDDCTAIASCGMDKQHYYTVVCDGTSWDFSTSALCKADPGLDGCVIGPLNNVTESPDCDADTPLLLVFTGMTVSGCCTGTITVTVTETPP